MEGTIKMAVNASKSIQECVIPDVLLAPISSWESTYPDTGKEHLAETGNRWEAVRTTAFHYFDNEDIQGMFDYLLKELDLTK